MNVYVVDILLASYKHINQHFKQALILTFNICNSMPNVVLAQPSIFDRINAKLKMFCFTKFYLYLECDIYQRYLTDISRF